MRHGPPMRTSAGDQAGGGVSDTMPFAWVVLLVAVVAVVAIVSKQLIQDHLRGGKH